MSEDLKRLKTESTNQLNLIERNSPYSAQPIVIYIQALERRVEEIAEKAFNAARKVHQGREGTSSYEFPTFEDFMKKGEKRGA